MYSDFNNQLLNIFRCGFAFSIVYLLWPFFLFNDRQLSLDGFVSRYAKMVFLTIVLGYVLIVLKLYEVISLVAIFFFLSLYKATNGGLWRRKSKVSANRGINWFFDLLDGQVHIGGTIRKGLNRFAFVFQQVLFNNFGSFVAVANSLLFAAVFLFSSYLRFYDAIMHAAPAMSDAYVTLAWMKYMDQRLLFHDGIYPQGFHIYLSIIRKFATNDHLYILKYIGPMNTVLITLGLYFFILKITKQILPAIMAAFVFGVLGGSITGIEWSRQVSTNSQEFALVFLLPAWYFILSYLQSSNKSYLWTAFVCCGIIGLVHTIVFLFLIIG
ncbi:MAG: hypothetical protein HGA27_03015, partial [Peptococcaceae bacterium]|nr:hypothetical protein [Peptococcaceae bacterium]